MTHLPLLQDGRDLCMRLGAISSFFPWMERENSYIPCFGFFTPTQLCLLIVFSVMLSFLLFHVWILRIRAVINPLLFHFILNWKDFYMERLFPLTKNLYCVTHLFLRNLSPLCCIFILCVCFASVCVDQRINLGPGQSFPNASLEEGQEYKLLQILNINISDIRH